MPSRDALKREALNAVLITLGVLSAGMGLYGFLLSSRFIDGGVTGVSMLLAKTTKVPLSAWLPLINVPFIALGWRQIGGAFAARSVLAIAGLSLALAHIPYPDVTPDLLLTAAFGGVFIGAGIGLAVRGGAVLDGTEIAALLLSKRYPALTMGDVILIFNVVLFLAAMSLLGVEPALYSILTYVAAAKTLNFVIYGVEEYMALTVVSREATALRERITSELGRGLTVYRGYGGVSGDEHDILYCVVTRLELGRVMGIVRGIDPAAFMVHHPLSGAEGGLLKKSLPH
ncbi:MAG: YitT family protein [Elusimicrobiota bacterium]|nr:MAG: YitT family protein [Elusimicrobiota bacterium]